RSSVRGTSTPLSRSSAPPPLLSPAASPLPLSLSVDQSWINPNLTSSTPIQ
ncbi:unnamed protein product, partial [Brassica oleracea var. botrytis]